MSRKQPEKKPAQPYSTEISDKPRGHQLVKIGGDCVTNGEANVGVQNTFYVETPRGNKDSPGISIFAPAGGFCDVDVTKVDGVLFECKFVPASEGLHKLMVCFQGMNVPGSPVSIHAKIFVPEVPKRGQSSTCSTSPLHGAQEAQPTAARTSSVAEKSKRRSKPLPSHPDPVGAAAEPLTDPRRSSSGAVPDIRRKKTHQTRPATRPVTSPGLGATVDTDQDDVDSNITQPLAPPAVAVTKERPPPRKPRSDSVSLPLRKNGNHDKVKPWDRVAGETKTKLRKCLKTDAEMVFGKVLGEGQFGKVFEVRVQEKDQGAEILAAKAIKDADITQDQLDEFMEEALLMNHFKHRNVLQLEGVIVQDGFPYILIPIMAHGSLIEYLRKHKNNIPTSRLIDYSLQVAQGMKYISSLKFVHRDLAARNCLLSDKHVLKISDFGLARDNFRQNYVMASKFKQLPLKWMAPEIFASWTFTSETDVWSYGILLWEMFSYGSMPYKDIDNRCLLTSLKCGQILEQPKNAPSDIYSIMTRCWNLEPSERPTFAELAEDLEAYASGPHQVQDDTREMQQTFEKCRLSTV